MKLSQSLLLGSRRWSPLEPTIRAHFRLLELASWLEKSLALLQGVLWDRSTPPPLTTGRLSPSGRPGEECDERNYMPNRTHLPYGG